MDKYITIGKGFCACSTCIESIRLFGTSSVIVGINENEVINTLKIVLDSPEKAIKVYNRVKRILLSRNNLVFVGNKKLDKELLENINYRDIKK